MRKISVECFFCHKIFEKEIGPYNWSIKQKWKIFCSKECRNKFFTKSKQVNCLTCGKEITITRSQEKNSKSGKFFCGHTCSAKHSNSRRILDEKSKIKTSQSLIKYYKNNVSSKKFVSNSKIYYRIPKARVKIPCMICGKIFKQHTDEKCCSKKCGQIYQYGSLPYTKDEMVNIVATISQELKRTPQQRECESRLLHAARKFFGSWNKAMEHCGLKPNGSKYQKTRLRCCDGHMADSISEKTVDEWLFQNEINHERNKTYLGNNRQFNCDFYLPDYDIWIEYFGLIGQVEEYDIAVQLKRQIARDNNLNLIEILPSDLYPNNKLDGFLDRIKTATIE